MSLKDYHAFFSFSLCGLVFPKFNARNSGSSRNRERENFEVSTRAAKVYFQVGEYDEEALLPKYILVKLSLKRRGCCRLGCRIMT